MTISELHSLFILSAGICTDTRAIKPNQLFFAIKGDNFDGNKFAKKALELGASYAIVQDESLTNMPKTILVNDVLKTLQNLAQYHRKQFKIPVIAITGTNGKTTSKELINAVLTQKYKVLVTEGNLNNHLGVPFTLLRLNASHQIAIIEMGANKPGDIKELADIALPTHGAITNVGKAHLEGFGDIDGVIKTKTELYKNLKAAKGKIFINQNDEKLAKHLPNNVELIGYGSSSSKIRGAVSIADPFISFSWKTDSYVSPTIQTQLVGDYNLNNFLLAISIGDYFKVPADDINFGLSHYQPSNNRSQITITNRNTLIVDCYNANPTSMESAINSFKTIKAKNKLMVLGDMLELGAIKNKEHQTIIDMVKKEGHEVIFVGRIFQSLNPPTKSYETVEALIANENLNALTQKTILLKGSRGIKLESLIALL